MLEVTDIIRRTEEFLISQVSDSSPGWGSEPFVSLDPWTTSQVCAQLSNSTDANRRALRTALAWLETKQGADGSWGSATHPGKSDTPSTANGAIAHLRHFGPKSYTAQKALDWLVNSYNNGWTTLPTERNPRFTMCHHYSTAYALRALSRGPKITRYSLCIHEGISALQQSRTDGSGWGFRPKGPADPTFTCYVIHGLIDVSRLAGIKVSSKGIEEALNWLITEQCSDGAWYDWHGIAKSPEATAYVVYITLSTGMPFPMKAIEDGVSWLIRLQNQDGSWSMNPIEDNGRPNNWVTQTVLMALTAVDKFKKSDVKISHPIDYIKAIELDHSGYDKSANPIYFDTDYKAEPSSDPSFSLDLHGLYETSIPVLWGDLPLCGPSEHTMSEAIERYVRQKLPCDVMQRSLEQGNPIHVHGIHPDHFSTLAPSLGYKSCQSLEFSHKTTSSPFNSQRPRFFNCTHSDGSVALAIAVIPGRDYLLHYATLVRHFAHFLIQEGNADEMVRIFRYPVAENSVAHWTGLSSNLIQPRDIVVLGHIPELASHFESCYRLVERRDEKYFGTFRYEIGPQCFVTLLGVKYCFWGSIAAHIGFRLCELNAIEILYVAKLGTLTSPSDIYKRIFCPSIFVELSYDTITHTVKSPPNRLLESYPSINTGCHVSVPTVLEEDYIQRYLATQINAQSIDNEISQIARTVSLYNEINQTTVAFSALHFATDYLRKAGERELPVPFDLSTNRTENAKNMKNEIIKRIFDDYLRPYLDRRKDDYR